MGTAMKITLRLCAIALALGQLPCAFAQGAPRDQFFWLGEINKATAVINTDEGLLDKALAPRLAAGVAKVIADGNQPGGKRPSTVITFEPLLIQAAGQEVTLLHAGRSSQDMHATYRAAILREDLLRLSTQLDLTRQALVEFAARNRAVVVPNYTNGVAAQANSLGHEMLGYAAGLDRDAERIRQAYARIDRSPMGTTVLNGTSWPLDRVRMAEYLGFPALVDNAYDAAQISSAEEPVEVGAVVSSIALHAGNFIEDIMVQYAGPRPWIVLAQGSTYVSSAMPQKHNPGLLNDTRRDASTVLSLGMGPLLRAHNLPAGMPDAKEVRDNTAMVNSAIGVLKNWQRILGALVVSRERALEALNSDWTASQELADLLMRKYKVPFRIGHHFASNVVTYARAHDIRPLDFPFAEARRIYRELPEEDGGELPMTEAEFRAALDPVAIVNARATRGGPQPAEMERMLAQARSRIAQDDQWVAARRQHIDQSLAKLDADFDRLLKTSGR
jgi:argininosuccinate lyase